MPDTAHRDFDALADTELAQQSLRLAAVREKEVLPLTQQLGAAEQIIRKLLAKLPLNGEGDVETYQWLLQRATERKREMEGR